MATGEQKVWQTAKIYNFKTNEIFNRNCRQGSYNMDSDRLLCVCLGSRVCGQRTEGDNGWMLSRVIAVKGTYMTALQLKPDDPAHIVLSLADFLFWSSACVYTALHAVIIVMTLYNDVVCTEFRRRREGSPGDGEGPGRVGHLYQVFRQQV